ESTGTRTRTARTRPTDYLDRWPWELLRIAKYPDDHPLSQRSVSGENGRPSRAGFDHCPATEKLVTIFCNHPSVDLICVEEGKAITLLRLRNEASHHANRSRAEERS